MAKKKEHWRRDEPQFFNFLALDREPMSDAPDVVGGLPGALLSKDIRTEDSTLLVELPAGWRYEFDGKGASLELLVLQGRVAHEDNWVGPGGYIHLPQGGGGGELSSENGALTFVFWELNRPSFPPPYTENRAVRFREVPYELMPRDSESHGLLHKSMRLPDPSGGGEGSGEGGPGGFVRIMYLPPGEISPFEHAHHECWEELYVLQGDILIVDEGVHGLGSVNMHPQEWWHGPYVSRFGALCMVHTDAPMGHPWGRREYPFQREIVDAYLDEADWGVNEEHTDWVETPWRRFQDLPEFKNWAVGEGAEEFADIVGKDTVSKFRAAWERRL